MNRKVITALGLALAFSVGALAQGSSTDPAPPPKRAEAKPDSRASKTSGYPFRGKLKAVDPTAKTLTLTGKEKDRVFHVTAETKFTKDGKPATLADGAQVDEVAGYARTGTDGRAEAVTVRFGPVPADAPPKKSSAKRAPAPPETERAR